MKKFLILPLFLLFSFSHKGYASVCGDVKQSIFTNVLFFQTSVDCQFLEEVLGSLKKVSSFFNRNINTHLFIQNHGTNASFDNGHIIWLPKKLYAYDEKSNQILADTRDLSPILLHEIGHAFLHQRIKESFNQEFGDLFSSLEQVSDSFLKNTHSGKKISMSSRRFGSHISQTPEFAKYLAHIVGYTELYADTVAVLYFNDPDIMLKSLEFATYTPESSALIFRRGFNHEHQHSDSSMAATVHTEFSPTRTYLGKVMQSQINLEPNTLLKHLEDSIVEQITEELRLNSLPNLKSRNYSLIKKIQAKIKSQEL